LSLKGPSILSTRCRVPRVTCSPVFILSCGTHGQTSCPWHVCGNCLTITAMLHPAPHRKQVRHFNEPGHCHELTFSCFHRLPLLNHAFVCQLLSESIDRALVQQGFWLIAFVYMPEHVHLLVFPATPTARIERLLFAIKRPFSYHVKQYLRQHDLPLLRQLNVQERPGKTVFRFWQEGPGYDRNLTSREALLSVIEYIHNNPIRRGLSVTPGQWKWSSWRYYHQPSGLHELELPTVHGVQDLL
jgi:putative transposase